MDSEKRVLVTGSNGFVASHLIPALRKNGFSEIYGLSLEADFGLIKSENYFQADISNAKETQEIVEKVKPEIIFHLAALLNGTARSPVKTMKVNFDGTLNLLEALRLNESDAVIHFAGSCLEYGGVQAEELPVKENVPLRPYNSYGASKAAAEMLAIQYHSLYGLKTVITRAFQHVGSGKKGEALVCNEWSKKIALIESGELAELKIGNPELERDFLDVRDIVQAYLLAVKKCGYGTPYNICSEKATKLGRVLEILKKKKKNWKQEISLEQSLQDTLNFWREKIKRP